MSHDHMSMGSMSVGGLPSLMDFPKFYWAVVGSAVAVGTLVNVFNHILYKQRMSAARAGLLKPAKPKSLFFLSIAVFYALFREASNFSIRIPIRNRIFRLPTFGRTFLILSNFVVCIVLCFYGFDLKKRWSRQDIAYRCGFITVAQIPLLFLLAGKNNIIGFLTGISHERLNWIHRWCARCMLLTATLHMGYLFADWAPYDYIGIQLKENTIAQQGMVAWAVLVWMVFSSMTPIRGWFYEFFVLQHLVSFAVFIGFVYIHTPVEVHAYIWIPVGLFFFDRAVRLLRVLYANLSILHSKTKKAGQVSGLWACKAEFTPLPHNTTRITIPNPPIDWQPGQFVFLSCHSIAPLQSHPFTVASIPADGKMEFLVKAETGGTMRFLRHAEKTHGLPQSAGTSCSKNVAIEGPYGCLRPLRQFDSVVLLAGSTGATFTVPLLRDILQGWTENANPVKNNTSLFSLKQLGAVTRHVRFVWVVKSRGQLGWFASQLSSVYTDFQTLQSHLREIKLEITIYVTCDDSFTEEHKSLLSTITAPNHSTPQKPPPSKGYTVDFRSRTPSLDETYKSSKTTDHLEILPLNRTSLSSTETKNANACGPDGTCCCKTTIDESSPDAITPCCCCKPSTDRRNRPTSTTPSSQSDEKQSLKPLIHPGISVFSGRPDTRSIVRKSLEQAFGESAVVVCGPQGLVADVKYDVCALSDERAVHKGTGAQGVYLHTESFRY